MKGHLISHFVICFQRGVFDTTIVLDVVNVEDHLGDTKSSFITRTERLLLTVHCAVVSIHRKRNE